MTTYHSIKYEMLTRPILYYGQVHLIKVIYDLQWLNLVEVAYLKDIFTNLGRHLALQIS